MCGCWLSHSIHLMVRVKGLCPRPIPVGFRSPHPRSLNLLIKMLWGPRCEARLLNSRLAQGEQRKYRNFAWAAHRASISILTRKWPSRVSNRQKFPLRGAKAGASPPRTHRDPGPCPRTYVPVGAGRPSPPLDIQYNTFSANDHITSPDNF